MLDKCSSSDFDTFEYTRQIAFHNWGIESWGIDELAYLSQLGTEFLHYFASEVAVREILDYLQMQLSPYKIDPIIINACGIAVPRKDQNTIEKLTNCLK